MRVCVCELQSCFLFESDVLFSENDMSELHIVSDTGTLSRK